MELVPIWSIKSETFERSDFNIGVDKSVRSTPESDSSEYIS